jgi:hypothetical protein
MLPVLIVCYLRPEKLEALLGRLKNSGRKVFVYIDRADAPHFELNTKVLDVAMKYIDSIDIKIYWAERNQGVGLGVPSALDWVFDFEDEVIILEDDCLPTEDAYTFFDDQSLRITGEIVMACGTSPWQTERINSQSTALSVSSYPLIWGWSTNSKSWFKLRTLIQTRTPHLRVLKAILLNPSRVKILCFFYAAVIRVNRGKLKAWDSPVALEMLLSGYKAIIANKSLIQNSGQDENASHFSNPGSLLSEVVSQSQMGRASSHLDRSAERRNEIDKKIENSIYLLKRRHVFSPIKALIGF